MKLGEQAVRPPSNLRSEDEIIASWDDAPDKPVVSILCATFNHFPLIRDALNGFLMQETSFPFNIVIHDDASSDGTADVLREYEKRFPRIIQVIIQSTNLYSQGLRRDKFVKPYCKGRYIAWCEGDDYWLDPKKLQIQVGFLEENPDFVMSGHDAVVVDEFGVVRRLGQLPGSQKRDFDCNELIHGQAWILTMSRVSRNVEMEPAFESRFIQAGDVFLSSRMGLYGKYKFHSDIVPACYRRHAGGIWSLTSENDRFAATVSTLLWIGRFYRRINKDEVAKQFEKRVFRSTLGRIPFMMLIREMVVRVFFLRSLRRALNARKN